MKKIVLFSVLLLAFFLTTGMASARVHFGFRFYGPPVISVPPPAYPYPYPYGYDGPGYYGHRVWEPGYWDTVWTHHGWERVWHPGHWEYRP